MSVTFNTKNSVSPAIPQIAIYMNQDSYGRLDIADTPPFIIEKLKNKVKATSAAASVSNSRINDPWFKPPTWVASTGYFTGQVVVGLDGVNTYICKDAGTSASSGGPTGSGYSLITDGTVTWYWNGIVRGLGNATNIVTQDLLSNLLTSIPNARSYQPSLSVPVGYWSGGVVEYDPSSGVTVNVRGSNTATVGSPYYASTPGASFTFITDSTKFILASYNAIYQNITFVVEINDRLLDDSLIYTSAQKNPGGYLFDLSNIPGTVGKFNKIRIISSGGFFTIASKVYIEPSASIYAPQNSNRWSMAVEGDSLTAGGNGTPYHSGLDWVTQVGSMLGCDNAI
ncbi:MAG TPA: hypothetical protein VFM18_10960, partial [Methanosarcina sp.]|nr:hypothetical protein [Methanosarcina sp.]